MKKYLTEWWVTEQTRRLVEYAKDEIKKIGDKINSYNSRNHMDRTGHLLNSLCWAVAYDNKLVEYGFYRDAVLHAARVPNEAEPTSESYIHEFYADYKYAFPVNGRALAENYIKRYGKMTGVGRWRVFFAVLAPYWGYWEQGFTLRHGFSKRGGFMGASFRRFAVMAETYDAVSNDLSPANMKFEVHVETYTKPYSIGKLRMKGSIEKAWINRVDKPQYSSSKRKR